MIVLLFVLRLQKCLSYQNCSTELFVYITATADLPCGLDNLVQNLPPYSSVTANSLIQNHTLYPFYALFLPPKRAKKVRNLMKSNKGRNIHTIAGVMELQLVELELLWV